jgi:hypothetical protein
MKLLLACDGEHRQYIEAIAKAITTFRSYVDVAVIDIGGLETEAERFNPHLVIISGASIPPNPIDLQLLGHIELSPESDRPSKFRVGERFWESVNPTVGETLSVVDEVHALSSTSREQEPTDTDEAQT